MSIIMILFLVFLFLIAVGDSFLIIMHFRAFSKIGKFSAIVQILCLIVMSIGIYQIFMGDPTRIREWFVILGVCIVNVIPGFMSNFFAHDHIRRHEPIPSFIFWLSGSVHIITIGYFLMSMAMIYAMQKLT